MANFTYRSGVFLIDDEKREDNQKNRTTNDPAHDDTEKKTVDDILSKEKRIEEVKKIDSKSLKSVDSMDRISTNPTGMT